MEVPKMKKNNCKLTEIKATAIQSNILRKQNVIKIVLSSNIF